MYTSRDLTAYPRLKTSYSAEDLASFTPEEHEVALAEKVARLIPQQLAFVTLLKSFQQLSYFPSLRDVPLKVVEFIARSMGVPPQLPPDYERSRTLYRHSQIIREHLGYRRYDHKVARKLMRAAMYLEAWIKDDVPPELPVEREAPRARPLPGDLRAKARCTPVRNPIQASNASAGLPDLLRGA
jgi:hypothetical protein